MDDEIVIKVEHVYKDFVLPHQRANSVKSLFTSIAKGRGGKSIETQHALKDISFEIKKGEFFGVVGRNGSGKSTLLKILAGIYQPTSGSVVTKGKLVPFIELGVGFNPELTGRENVYLNGAMLGFSQKEVEDMYDKIVAFAELEKFMDQKLKNYSSGMQVRLAFSMATRSEADILLVDEVLAVGDADFQRKCFEYFRSLKKNKKTVVFVSHDMSAVREYCDRAVLIEHNKLILEDRASRIAIAYTRMFIEQSIVVDTEKEIPNRWGDNTVVYKKVSIEKNKLTDKDETLTIHATATATKEVNHPIFGFSVKSASDVQLLGTNNKIKEQEVPSLKPGDEVNITWSVPNVFNDGLHYIDLAIHYDNGSSVAEWWEESMNFSVAREEKTPYVIAPPLALKLSILKDKSEK